MRRVPAIVAFVFVALLLAACGSNTTSTTTTTTTAGPPTSASTRAPRAGVTTSTPPDSAPADFATTAVSVPSDDALGTALLTAVRSAAQDGFDRVTFEFANHLPGYGIDYVPRPILQDGSGTETPVGGAAVLQVRMTPASGFDLSGGGTETYVGAERFTPGTPAIVEVVRTGDFEANLTWVVGVTSQAGFKVSTLASPPRLVVDVAVG